METPASIILIPQSTAGTTAWANDDPNSVSPDGLPYLIRSIFRSGKESDLTATSKISVTTGMNCKTGIVSQTPVETNAYSDVSVKLYGFDETTKKMIDTNTVKHMHQIVYTFVIKGYTSQNTGKYSTRPTKTSNLYWIYLGNTGSMKWDETKGRDDLEKVLSNLTLSASISKMNEYSPNIYRVQRVREHTLKLQETLQNILSTRLPRLMLQKKSKKESTSNILYQDAGVSIKATVTLDRTKSYSIYGNTSKQPCTPFPTSYQGNGTITYGGYSCGDPDQNATNALNQVFNSCIKPTNNAFYDVYGASFGINSDNSYGFLLHDLEYTIQIQTNITPIFNVLTKTNSPTFLKPNGDLFVQVQSQDETTPSYLQIYSGLKPESQDPSLDPAKYYPSADLSSSKVGTVMNTKNLRVYGFFVRDLQGRPTFNRDNITTQKDFSGYARFLLVKTDNSIYVVQNINVSQCYNGQCATQYTNNMLKTCNQLTIPDDKGNHLGQPRLTLSKNGQTTTATFQGRYMDDLCNLLTIKDDKTNSKIPYLPETDTGNDPNDPFTTKQITNIELDFLMRLLLTEVDWFKQGHDVTGIIFSKDGSPNITQSLLNKLTDPSNIPCNVSILTPFANGFRRVQQGGISDLPFKYPQESCTSALNICNVKNTSENQGVQIGNTTVTQTCSKNDGDVKISNDEGGKHPCDQWTDPSKYKQQIKDYMSKNIENTIVRTNEILMYVRIGGGILIALTLLIVPLYIKLERDLSK